MIIVNKPDSSAPLLSKSAGEETVINLRLVVPAPRLADFGATSVPQHAYRVPVGRIGNA